MGNKAALPLRDRLRRGMGESRRLPDVQRDHGLVEDTQEVPSGISIIRLTTPARITAYCEVQPIVRSDGGATPRARGLGVLIAITARVCVISIRLGYVFGGIWLH